MSTLDPRHRPPQGPAHRLRRALAADRASRRRAGRAAGRPARPRVRAHDGRAAADARRARRRARPDDLAVEPPEVDRLGALRIDDLALVLNLIFAGGDRRAVLLAWRSPRRASRPRRVPRAAAASRRACRCSSRPRTWSTLFLGLELLSIPLYVLCATEMRREHSLESGLKYLIVGSVGSATLLYGLAMIYGATGATDFAAIAARSLTADRRRAARRPAAADRHRAGWSGSPSRPRWRRSTSGRPTSTRARRRRSRRSWRSPPRRPRSACSCASSTSR